MRLRVLVVGNSSREEEVIIRIMATITMDGTKIAAVEEDTEEVTTEEARAGAGPDSKVYKCIINVKVLA